MAGVGVKVKIHADSGLVFYQQPTGETSWHNPLDKSDKQAPNLLDPEEREEQVRTICSIQSGPIRACRDRKFIYAENYQHALRVRRCATPACCRGAVRNKEIWELDGR
jgi:hypothetical protein